MMPQPPKVSETSTVSSLSPARICRYSRQLIEADQALAAGQVEAVAVVARGDRLAVDTAE
jgi:hypothetical protein